ncbi:unnamed protein product [Clavelina lepadiformis]|uniref:Uncharacterized protein n=1 Tax=Clavelina lepadiformis TaxID=159417 RepID=A0ABP0GYK9_CLALP
MSDRLNSDHLQLLYHCEVWWLSKGCVFNRHFELSIQVYMFLQDQCSPLTEHYVNDYFYAKLAYLSDVFDQLNQLNMSMQGRNSSVFLVANKVEGFKKKISLWERKVKDKRLDIFHCSAKYSNLLLMWTFLNQYFSILLNCRISLKTISRRLTS